MPAKPEIQVQESTDALFQAAAKEFVRLAKAAVKGGGRFAVALAGGSTPKSLYSLLASGTVTGIPWDKTYVFFADERHVPPDHAESNFRMANETLLSKVPLAPDHIFRVPAEIPDPDTAALSYEQTLRQFFALKEEEMPRFDLILLGMGPDGHTASLFPGTAALQDNENLVAANWVEKLKTWRITLTYPVLNHAAHVIFMVTGAEKADSLYVVLRGEHDPETYPAQRVKPTKGRVLWLVDSAAAARLT